MMRLLNKQISHNIKGYCYGVVFNNTRTHIRSKVNHNTEYKIWPTIMVNCLGILKSKMDNLT